MQRKEEPDTLTEIIGYLRAMLIVLSNAVVMAVFRRLPNSKRSTSIFFGQLALSGLVLGVGFLVQTLLYSFAVPVSRTACAILIAARQSTVGVYTANLIFIYAELYLGLRRMRPGRPVFTRRSALVAVVVAWLVCLVGNGFGVLFAIRKSDAGDACRPVVTFEFHFLLLIEVLWAAAIVLLVFLHGLSYAILKRLLRARNSQPAVADAAASSRRVWIERQQSGLNMIVWVMATASTCWGFVVVKRFVILFCLRCLDEVPVFLLVLSRISFVVPVLSNGIIYLCRSRAFRSACKKVFLRYNRVPTTLETVGTSVQLNS